MLPRSVSLSRAHVRSIHSQRRIGQTVTLRPAVVSPSTKTSLSLTQPRSLSVLASSSERYNCNRSLSTLSSGTTSSFTSSPSRLFPIPVSRFFSSAAQAAPELNGARLNPDEFDFKILTGGVKQLQKLLKKQPGRYLRLTVNSGGCSGYQYEFKMEDDYSSLNKNGDDIVFEQDGVRCVVDEMSLDFLGSCEIDYTSEMIRSSFQVVKNSNAENSCGCGASFSVGSSF